MSSWAASVRGPEQPTKLEGGQRYLSATLVPSPFTTVTESETPLVSETDWALQNRSCTAVLGTLAPTYGHLDWLWISLQIQLSPWQSEQSCSPLRSRLVAEKKHSKCVLTLFYNVGTTARRMYVQHGCHFLSTWWHEEKLHYCGELQPRS